MKKRIQFVEKVSTASSLIFPAISLILGGLVFFSQELVGIPEVVRWILGIIVVAGAVFCGVCVMVHQRWQRKFGKKAKSEHQQTVHDISDILLNLVREQCVSSGNWRVTLLKESPGADGEIMMRRVRRCASHPEFSGGGTEIFPARRSVLRAIDALDFMSTNNSPVDFRVNFPDKSENATEWTKTHESFVGDRAAQLRMVSRSYGWRRIAPQNVGDSPHVLLVESTHPTGITRQGLENPLLDSIASVMIRALRDQSDAQAQL